MTYRRPPPGSRSFMTAIIGAVWRPLDLIHRVEILARQTLEHGTLPAPNVHRMKRTSSRPEQGCASRLETTRERR